MCESCGVYLVEDLENLETASVMFIHWIIGSDVPTKFGQYAFIQLEMDIADDITMKYQTLFVSEESDSQIEFGILYKDGLPVAVSRRVLVNGGVEPDSVGLYRLYPEELSLENVYATLSDAGVSDKSLH